MILKQLLNGRKHSEFVLIQDDLNLQGIKFLHEFIKENLQRENLVHFFSYENDIYPELDDLKHDRNFLYNRCHLDPWNLLNLNVHDTSFNAECLKTKLKSDRANLVIVDSFSYVLLDSSLKQLCQNLKKIFDLSSEYRIQLVGVIHTSEHDSIEYKQLKNIASSVINLSSTLKGIKACVLHYQSPGVVTKENYHATYENNELKFSIIKEDLKEEVEPQIDPTTLTTFKLSLNDDEILSRSRVQLPYLRNKQTGAIFYEPDQNDDWDDEDPDDDLDI